MGEVTTRPVGPTDRAQARAIAGRAADAPYTHMHCSAAGPALGLALWIDPAGENDEPELTVIDAPPTLGTRTMYALALACALDARSHGHARARFRILRRALLDQLARDFAIHPVASGWDPHTGAPAEWTVHVDLEDAIAQLRARA